MKRFWWKLDSLSRKCNMNMHADLCPILNSCMAPPWFWDTGVSSFRLLMYAVGSHCTVSSSRTMAGPSTEPTAPRGKACVLQESSDAWPHLSAHSLLRRPRFIDRSQQHLYSIIKSQKRLLGIYHKEIIQNVSIASCQRCFSCIIY